MVFKDTEFEMQKAYREFKNNLLKCRFTNADSIRSLEDNTQLALMLFNMPKFDTIDKLKEWLNKEYIGK